MDFRWRYGSAGHSQTFRLMPPMEQVLSFLRRCLRWWLIEWRFHAWFGAIAATLSCYLAIHTHRLDYFARSGAIVTLCGLLMTFREYLRRARDLYWRDTGLADQPAFGRLNQMEARPKARVADAKALRVGLLYTVIGTTIWAYGDLLLNAFGFLR
jgi:hypothetical protein